ncbi:MAG: hypothetical protein V4676_11495, partial [Bacteroidota bacterium]
QQDKLKAAMWIEGTPVEVSTFCHATSDAVSVKVNSRLIKMGSLKINLQFPYPTGAWTDEGTNFAQAEKHFSQTTIKDKKLVVVQHQLDATRYDATIHSSKNILVTEKAKHKFSISPEAKADSFDVTVSFSEPSAKYHLQPTYAQTKISSQQSWRNYWQSGGAIDFSGSTDTRAFELERRIILSQYLMRSQEAGYYPPQETGLTYNSWFGKPHLEMHWWHATHYALWGRIKLLEKSLSWYKKVFPIAKSIAQRQGFKGARWQKMTDNTGEETPSSIGALLIWQQPHFIYFAELCYRNKTSKQILDKYKELVFATADFMASFPYYDSVTKRYILGKGLIPAQERFKAEETFNPTYELVYWKWALSVAQKWRNRLGMPADKKWEEVMQKLSPLPVQDNLYLAAESATDSYTNPEYKTDHPSVLAALGVMPSTNEVDKTIMTNTFNWVWKNWSWNDTWGWDFPMTAMTATRLGMPDKAIDALLMPVQTNTYLANGHNYQDERLRVYMPGNGGLLTAIAMMVAGYDDNKTTLPGILKNGTWKVKWEGLKKMP